MEGTPQLLTRARNYLASGKVVWALLFVGTVFFSITATGAYITYVGTLHGITDKAGNVLGRDFKGSWTTILLLKEHDISGIYSTVIYPAMLRSLFGTTGQPWVYPPHYLFLLWPFVYISSYAIAYALWSVFNIVAFASAMFWRSTLGFTWRWIALFAPSAVLSLFMGQNGLLSAALLIGGFRLLAVNPWLSGILFGLLTFKPQLGILIPFILLALRQYKAIAGTAITFAVLVFLSGWFFGWQSWPDFFYNAWHMQSQVAQLLTNRLVSLYAAILMLGLPLPLSRALQLAIAVIVTVMLCLRLSQMRNAHWNEWLRLAMPAVYLVTPYLYIYDLCALNAAWILWLERQWDRKISLLETAVWLMLWYIPFFSGSLMKNGTSGFPLTPLLLVLAFILAWWRARPANSAHQSANP